MRTQRGRRRHHGSTSLAQRGEMLLQNVLPSNPVPWELAEEGVCRRLGQFSDLLGHYISRGDEASTAKTS